MKNDDSDYVSLGDVCRDAIGIQCQYGSRYVNGIGGFPRLADDLRILRRDGDYHDMRIHRDDVNLFVERVLSKRVSTR